jgi:para-aminobenzoate synthetase component 2
MGIRHRRYNVEGVQFHPESILAIKEGYHLIENFIRNGRKSK